MKERPFNDLFVTALGWQIRLGAQGIGLSETELHRRHDPKQLG